jgi:hypothetical protein
MAKIKEQMDANHEKINTNIKKQINANHEK